MKALVEFLAKSLVEHPESVSVWEEQRGDAVVYHISVAPEDVGKVIGRQGRIAQSLRTVVSAAAVRQKRRVFVDIDS
ncbi:KH domain-containing protein [Alicyclobacillaceae bacterium I2511]|nr:KH domain-containing protein [Alicyclobacillaceae bacterium I2511]